MSYSIYVGTYSVRDSQGIYLLEGDTSTGALSIRGSWAAPDPAYLTIDQGILYASLECRDFESSGGGGVMSFTMDQDGSLRPLSAKAARGKAPCHICLSADKKKLYVSNYSSGSLSIFEADRGWLSEPSLITHSGRGPNEARQKEPHVHCAKVVPGKTQIAVADLGIDKVVFYETPSMIEAGTLSFDGGAGPRHLVFDKSGSYCWVLCELSSQVYAFEVSSRRRIGIYSTLPGDFAGQSHCAAIHLSPDGRFLYASNRGHDSIACFELREGGELGLLGIVKTGGKTPRDFCLSPDGAFLFAANQDSDTIFTFTLEKGLMKETGLSLDIPSPVCLIVH
ncbi:MAG: lactonase family protein [Treponema sp.]|nr:lactonase family protein [Treponema sp.]